MHSLSYENEFSFGYKLNERLCTWLGFEKEAQDNSEMAYSTMMNDEE